MKEKLEKLIKLSLDKEKDWEEIEKAVLKKATLLGISDEDCKLILENNKPKPPPIEDIKSENQIENLKSENSIEDTINSVKGKLNSLLKESQEKITDKNKSKIPLNKNIKIILGVLFYPYGVYLLYLWFKKNKKTKS
ncbi:MAG: hypothetical protein P8L72_05235 [Flavobacteriaceae bacterium]|nr:hypothetical protein [Flavobacteriaceae bacterium]MDG2314765.1 hypothetical protein [Flavobacteriaceae bacterium]